MADAVSMFHVSSLNACGVSGLKPVSVPAAFLGFLFLVSRFNFVEGFAVLWLKPFLVV